MITQISKKITEISELFRNLKKFPEHPGEENFQAEVRLRSDESLLSQDDYKGLFSSGLLVYSVLRLVDCNRIPLISSPSQKVESPALSGHLSP